MTEHTSVSPAHRILTPVAGPGKDDAQERSSTLAWHAAPKSVADTGVDTSMLVALTMKAAYLHRNVTLVQLAETLRLPASVLNEIAALAVRERMMEVAHRGANDLDVRFRLTDGGYARAAEFAARCSYVGPAPVTLEAYIEAVQQHSISRTSVSKADVTAALGDLTIPPHLLDEAGVALNAHRALMMYGPAGSGKTYLAQRLGSLLPGAVPVPHAITVAGEIIQVFDPLVHVPFDGEAQMARRPLDRRWTICHRPAVLSGGELTLSMLDMRFDPASGFYQAPPQMKANNGIYIIDDLGRQLVGVTELLNRWIVPLDRQIDVFTLQTGVRFTVPFDVWPVFSTNLDPAQLCDAAFLRRLGSKLHVGPLSPEDYREIYARACRDLGLHTPAPVTDFLVERLHPDGNMPLLACIPRDLLRLVASQVHYHGEVPVVTEAALHHAWHSYFGSHPDSNPEVSTTAATGWHGKALATR
ncbi:ATP-binding protein [Cupriavidus basilensis]